MRVADLLPRIHVGDEALKDIEMWHYEHSVDTTANQETLWRLWSDIPGGPRWNEGIAQIEFGGPFVAGSKFTMTPPGQDPIEMRIIEVVPGELFTDGMDAGDFLVRTIHRLDDARDGRTRVTYRTEITGPAADDVGPMLGPEITADFPQVIAALVKLAEA